MKHPGKEKKNMKASLQFCGITNAFVLQNIVLCHLSKPPTSTTPLTFSFYSTLVQP